MATCDNFEAWEINELWEKNLGCSLQDWTLNVFESNVLTTHAGHVNSDSFLRIWNSRNWIMLSFGYLARIIGQAVSCLGAMRNGCSPKNEDLCHMVLARIRMANPLCSMWIENLPGPSHAKPGPTFASLSQTYCCQARCWKQACMLKPSASSEFISFFYLLLLSSESVTLVIRNLSKHVAVLLFTPKKDRHVGVKGHLACKKASQDFCGTLVPESWQFKIGKGLALHIQRIQCIFVLGEICQANLEVSKTIKGFNSCPIMQHNGTSGCQS